MKNKVTIQEVAIKAGVSKTTISRFLNGKFTNMSSETKKRIQVIIDELEYRPSKQAQGLKSNKSWLIGLLVADIVNQYTVYLIKSIQDTLRDTGYQLIIMNTNNSEYEEQQALNKLIDQNVDGIILQPISNKLTSFLQIKKLEIPTVLIDRSLKDNLWTTIQTNNITVTKNMAKEIVTRGYNKIIHISEPIKNVSTRIERYQGVQLGVQDSNCEVELFEVKSSVEQDFIDLLSIQNNKEKICLFAANGNALYETVVGLKKSSFIFPNDYGLVGFDDWFWGELIQPGITTIHQFPERVGNEAAKCLIKNINRIQTPEKIEVNAEIYLRQSF